MQSCPPAGTRLAIVRHGEAYCNAESYIGGHSSCRGLTERGVRQVEALGERLRTTGELSAAAALYTSVLPRAVESAGGIVARALSIGEIEERCELCERHPGECDGLSWAEYEARYRRPSLPGDEPTKPLSAGGESWIEFVERAATALLEVACAHAGELVVVVAHGGIIDSSMISFLGLSEHGMTVRLHPEHSSITEWESVGSRWRLVRYNDAAHLEFAEAPDLKAPVPEWVRRDAMDLSEASR